MAEIDVGVYVYPNDLLSVEKSDVAYNLSSFDLDWTLIRPIKGKFSKNKDDWSFLPNRLTKLKKLSDDGYKIVIFTNQVSTGKKKIMILDRINNVFQNLKKEGISVWILVSTEKNMYRKPHIGMWNFVSKLIKINLEKSFYVGDAAGRPADFSDSDILFARNIQLKYFTPEDYFTNNIKHVVDVINKKQTMLIFVGMPGSGKTTFYSTYLQSLGFLNINQDNLKTHDNMLKHTYYHLLTGKSISIDATNPSDVKRFSYLLLSAELKIPTLILYFVRNGFGFNNLREHPVPQVGYNIYFKNLVEPSEKTDGVPVVEIF